jgi:hypothetical protein
MEVILSFALRSKPEPKKTSHSAIGEALIYVNQIDLTATISLKASVPHAPFTSKGHFDQDQWRRVAVPLNNVGC